MERWSVDLAKEHFKFSAAHFLIFPDGSAERLHGHNYRVFVELEAALSEHGLVLEFKAIKRVVRELIDRLDERFLVPGEHPVLRWSELASDELEVRYLERRYLMPREDALVLPINNTSSENLATYLGRELKELVPQRFPEVEVLRLRLAVEESQGQRGVYLFERPAG